ncbi:MAG TPA: inner membrane protein YhjD [Gordonia polyisoprenivorans]|uniref:YhjD/YihY/BrkB family envelope integrity protein n=1 Tax=Gordonia TaxID=2053 RepID=UPI0009ACE770|nr:MULTISPECIES: YhjD/YihY/BrkB family envelope integrity protein [unclassified Gordonia (in: high G+C Gram-positive bacteria)]MDF3284870.1 YhjD/YihY/BrkB family envelope integrity protein [Gordonia sp. N1V]OPX16148.1 inner membrane protein YhjD [Gordonia sp. i37]UZF58132.1 YihY/virulence factor BrkB family protein [Gordonia polyisoprenivorans]HCS58510.1 inner membrane protein YhjD [Gordonia polyisoprenivorans]
MGSVIAWFKNLLARAKEWFAAARERWPWLGHAMRTQERYTNRRGNVHAASISFNGILALVPILMVAFAIAAFVLASNPDLIEQLKDAVVKQLPGGMGDQIGSVIDSAISSRATVGIIGLVGAALTGVGWIAGVRAGMTEMFGGRLSRNALVSKVTDLLTFVVLGLAFAATMALTTLANGGGIVRKVLEWVGVDHTSWAPVLLRVVAIAISVFASWMLFTLVLARLPLVPLPFRNCLSAGLITAIAFEIIKNLGGLYLKSVLGSPAGAAFGPILGIMVFAYLASRIILYATAWCATDPINEDFQVDDEIDETQQRPVVMRPTVEVSPMPKVGALAGAAAVGAAVGMVIRRVRGD